jgi:hypothetical protein
LGSGGGGNPVEPSPAPAIASVEPADAAPGEPVTIHGENLAGGVTVVSFDGSASLLISTTAVAVEAVVPEVPDGDRSIVVSVDGRSSQPFSYRVAPASPPVITSIVPTRVHPGERITITGSRFSSAPPNRVFVGGVGATVESWTSTRITVFAPVLEPGVAALRVTAGPRQSNELPVEILRSKPLVTAVVPNPTRAGLWVTVRGAYLAGQNVEVLIDGLTAEHRSGASAYELQARVPTLDVGVHSLQVGVDGDLSDPHSLRTDDFDVSGVYDVEAEVVRTVALLPGCLPLLPGIGTRIDTQLELFDIRPDLTAKLEPGTRIYAGTVDSNGAITAPPGSILGPAEGIAGYVTRRQEDGRLEVDVTIVTVLDLGCHYYRHVTGLKRDTQSPPIGVPAP